MVVIRTDLACVDELEMANAALQHPCRDPLRTTAGTAVTADDLSGLIRSGLFGATVTGALEPAYGIRGESFDYAGTGDLADLLSGLPKIMST